MAKLDFSILTAREFEVIRLIMQGMLPRDIAIKLKLSPSSVNTYVSRAAARFGLNSRKAQRVFMLLTKAQREDATTIIGKARDLISPNRIQQAKFNEQSWHQWLFERDGLFRQIETYLKVNT